MAHWLALSGFPGQRTLYDGICRLEPGSLLDLRGGRVAARRYWTPRYERPLRAPREELVARLRERLTEAVRRRSTGEDSAVMLSGGLDSSTVAAVAARAIEPESRPSGSYSAIFPDHPSVDESALIDHLCGTLSLPSTQAVVRGGSVIAGALPYLERFELPPISPNLFFWNPLLRRAREDGIAVMLDGEGGDEVYGCSPMLLADRLRGARLLSLRNLMRQIPGGGGRLTSQARRRFWREYILKGITPAPIHRAVRRARGLRRYAPEVLTPATALAYGETLANEAWKSNPGPRWWAYLLEITVHGMGPAVTYDHVRRRAAMAGIEPRHPLVDVDVLELVLRLPPELAFDPDFNRPLLREATAGLLPDELRLRPTKSNFDAVFHAMLAGPDLPLVRALLGDPAARIGEFVELPALRQLMLEPDPPNGRTTRQRWAVELWRMATAELWLRQQEDPSAPRRFLEQFGFEPTNVELKVRELALT
jgi:asparagine synthase (glutamine-hydrolysing)